MRELGEKEVIELALIKKYRYAGETSISKNCVDKYKEIINKKEFKFFGNGLYSKDSLPNKDIIYEIEYRKNGEIYYVLKDEFIQNPRLLISRIMVNFSLNAVGASIEEDALNTIGLAKDENYNIKKLF